MAHPQVLDGGESLQLWMVAVNIMNMQPQTDTTTTNLQLSKEN
jgi:hypothetical protein